MRAEGNTTVACPLAEAQESIDKVQGKQLQRPAQPQRERRTLALSPAVMYEAYDEEYPEYVSRCFGNSSWIALVIAIILTMCI